LSPFLMCVLTVPSGIPVGRSRRDSIHERTRGRSAVAVCCSTVSGRGRRCTIVPQWIADIQALPPRRYSLKTAAIPQAREHVHSGRRAPARHMISNQVSGRPRLQSYLPAPLQTWRKTSMTTSSAIPGDLVMVSASHRRAAESPRKTR
jgi:hypothetical protein